MKNDILPPKRPQKEGSGLPTAPPQTPHVPPANRELAQEDSQSVFRSEQTSPPNISDDSRSLDLPDLTLPDEDLHRIKRTTPRMKMVVIGFILVLATILGVLWSIYVSALAPVDAGDTSLRRISIAPGSSVEAISEQLKQEGLIRNKLAFTLYARSINAGSRLQAGQYSLSPSESLQEIMSHLVSGSVDQFTITFLPGTTLRRLPGETNKERTDIKSTLLGAGYEEAEIEAAFSKKYDHPLFSSTPDDADLEGYVYGETYSFASSSSVEQVLEATFDEYYKVIEKNNLIQGFEAQGFTLHEGIILASIIQREVSSEKDQKQVAQVFLDRIELGMSLGADATFEYGAKKENIAANPSIDSPYNTRRFTGLPPGPISVPGESALVAVANPAEGDYLYFVSGDDGNNYFARTNAEHEENVRMYCQELCFGR